MHRALQRSNREYRFSLFLQDLAHQDVGSGGACVKPYGTLQQALGFVIFLYPRVSVGQLVKRRRIGRINREFLLEVVDRLWNLRREKMNFTQQLVGKWELGIGSDRFLRILFRNWGEFLTEQHARSDQVTGSGTRRHVEHLCEGLTCLGIVLGLN